jgi:hypothetical protein
LEADNTDVAERVFQAAAEAGVVLRELRREQTSLEDVFASLTTKEARAEESTASAEAPDAARTGDDTESSASPADEDAADAGDKEGT